MLSAAEVDRFHREGFLIQRQLVTGGELARLQEVTAAIIADGIARRGERHLYHERADGSSVYWRSEDLWQRDACFRALAVHPTLLLHVGQCIGGPFFPWNDSLVVKTPGGEGIGWHQDPPYGDVVRTSTHPMPNFTCDVYLDHSTPENGCLWAIPGHHLVGHVRLEDSSEEDHFTRQGAVPVRMQPGDVLFHALSTPHGSRPNRHGPIRRTVYFHYLTQAAHTACDYGRWKPGWQPTSQARLQAWTRERAGLGLATAPERLVRLGADGIAIEAEACSASDEWGRRAAALSPAERQRRQQLLGAAPAVAAGAS